MAGVEGVEAGGVPEVEGAELRVGVGVEEAEDLLGFVAHEGAGGGEVDVLLAAVFVDDAGALAGSVAHDQGVGGGGEDAGGDHVFAEDGVDQGGLSGVELAEDGDGQGLVEGVEEVVNAGKEGLEAGLFGEGVAEVGEGGDEVGGSVEGVGDGEVWADGEEGGVGVCLEAVEEGGVGGSRGVASGLEGDEGLCGVVVGEGDLSEGVEELGRGIAVELLSLFEEVACAGEVALGEAAAAHAEEGLGPGGSVGILEEAGEVLGGLFVVAHGEVGAGGSEEGVAVVGGTLEGGVVGLGGPVEVVDALVGFADEGVDVGGVGVVGGGVEGSEEVLVGFGGFTDGEEGSGGSEEGVVVVGVLFEDLVECLGGGGVVLVGGLDAAEGEEGVAIGGAAAVGFVEEFAGFVEAVAAAEGFGEDDGGVALVRPDAEGAAELAGGLVGAVECEEGAAEAEVEIVEEGCVGIEFEGPLEVDLCVGEVFALLVAEAEVEVAGGFFAEGEGFVEELDGAVDVAEVEVTEGPEVAGALDAGAAVLGLAEEAEGGAVIAAADGGAGALVEETDLLWEHDFVEEVADAVSEAVEEVHKILCMIGGPKTIIGKSVGVARSTGGWGAIAPRGQSR